MAHLAEYDAQKGAFSTWLFRIASNTLNSSFRGAPAKETEWEDFFDPAASPQEVPEAKVLAAEGQEELLKALDKLSERERRIMELKYWGGLGNKDIAEVLGITASNVGVLHHRALEHLRKLLPRD